jgi:hypothetical protein
MHSLQLAVPMSLVNGSQVSFLHQSSINFLLLAAGGVCVEDDTSAYKLACYTQVSLVDFSFTCTCLHSLANRNYFVFVMLMVLLKALLVLLALNILVSLLFPHISFEWYVGNNLQSQNTAC